MKKKGPFCFPDHYCMFNTKSGFISCLRILGGGDYRKHVENMDNSLYSAMQLLAVEQGTNRKCYRIQKKLEPPGWAFL